ncbi:hypothetical protein [Sinorhizobium fredii]|uniref:hypothetical protein n=1 Tax=Rhizobium fredii TaxID=380 RepID=UPI0004AFDCE0|nr:hypothetical protein [Sinorhizobium fredii]ASY69366.1 hypothetical protein SF83666_c19500 [Sinorhizobium fredii CCBAU 83666]
MNMQELRRLIDLIDARLSAVPDADWRDNGAWRAARQAEAQILIDLRDSEGATFKDSGLGVTLKLAGIRTTCTAGAAGVLRNWQAAAWRNIEQARVSDGV